jgi:hypothetical protein
VESLRLGTLLYGYFVRIVPEKHVRDAKSRKEHWWKAKDMLKTTVNIGLNARLACVFRVVVGEGFEPSFRFQFTYLICPREYGIFEQP